MVIESYSFGRMVIRGKVFTADLIIIGEEIFPNWWRREGHSLCPEDLAIVIEGGEGRMGSDHGKYFNFFNLAHNLT